MTYTPDYSMFTEIFKGTKIFGLTWIIGFVSIIIIILLISRNSKHWASLLLPATYISGATGLMAKGGLYWILIFTGIISFVISGLTVDTIGQLLSTPYTRWKTERKEYGRSLTKEERGIEKVSKLQKLQEKIQMTKLKQEYADTISKNRKDEIGVSLLEKERNLNKRKNIEKEKILKENKIDKLNFINLKKKREDREQKEVKMFENIRPILSNEIKLKDKKRKKKRLYLDVI